MKKGQAERYFVLFIFFIALALSISAVLVVRTNELRDPANFQKDFLASDIALVTNLLLGADHDVQLVYESAQDNASAFDYSYDSRIILSSGSSFELDGPSAIVDDEQGPRYAQYISRNGFLVSDRSVSQPGDSLYIVKQGSDVSLYSTIQPVSGSLDCELSSKRYSSVAIDPGHGSEGSNRDEGFSSQNTQLSESVYVSRLAGFITRSDTIPLVSLTRGGSLPDYQTVSQRIETISTSGSEVVVSLHRGNYDGSAALKAFVPMNDHFEESQALACRLLTEILGVNSGAYSDIDRAAIVPVSGRYLTENDPLRVLFTDRPSVQLEIGSVAVSSSFDQIPFPLSQAIISALTGGQSE